ncbi:MAG: DUF3291 domain-containing protein [Kiloniellales bacterium]
MDWDLAQVNIGRLVAPEGDPRVQEFFDELDRINALAEASPGFLWRLKTEEGNATAIKPTADPLLIVNLSVWRDADALFEFVYRSAHTPVMAKRKQFFQRFEGHYQALWWVAAGHRPSVDEALAKLWHLDRFGPTPHAFTFKARFPKPGRDGVPVDMEPDPWCVGWA